MPNSRPVTVNIKIQVCVCVLVIKVIFNWFRHKNDASFLQISIAGTSKHWQEADQVQLWKQLLRLCTKTHRHHFPRQRHISGIKTSQNRNAEVSGAKPECWGRLMELSGFKSAQTEALITRLTGIPSKQQGYYLDVNLNGAGNNRSYQQSPDRHMAEFVQYNRV